MATDQSKTSDLAKAGQAYYDEHLQSLVETEHFGKFLVLDVESGDYEIDEDDLAATLRLRTRHPNCLTYGVRIGYPTAYRLGGWMKPCDERETALSSSSH